MHIATQDPDTIVYAMLGLIAVLILIIIWMWVLHGKMTRLLRGKNVGSLEDSILGIHTELKDLKQFTDDMEKYLTTVEKRVKKSLQTVETIRFNPFKGTGSGGNNSFSTAFLNERGDGVILTSMYSRDRISMFAKPVKAFSSEYELSEEEREAIAKSKESLES